MEKINLVEILKDCPTDMELECSMFENTYFDKVCDDEDCLYQIICYVIDDGVKNTIKFTKYGRFNTMAGAKCVIFPKGKTTWGGFVSPCKFKVGDRITDKNKFIYRITEITDKGYKLHDLKTTFITFEEADLYFVKVVDVFDITTLKPFESRVLVRNVDGALWKPALYGFSPSKGGCHVVGGTYWKQCIPYEGNEHLLGQTDDCAEFYKTWE